MVWNLIGGMIGAGASLFGGAKQREFQGGHLNADRQLQSDALYKAMQIRQWDARKAGIHPLAALGVQSHTPSPVGVGYPDNSLSQAGQYLATGVASIKTKEQKVLAQIALRKAQAELDHMNLQNTSLRNEIARENQLNTIDYESDALGIGNNKTTIGKSYIPGQDGLITPPIPDMELNRTGKVKLTPMEQKMSSVPGVQAGYHALEQWIVDMNRYVGAKPTQELAEALESVLIDWIDYHAYRISRWLKPLFWYNHYNNPKAARHRERIVNEYFPPKIKNYHWRYNPYKDKFKLFPNYLRHQIYDVNEHDPKAKFTHENP